MESKNIDVHVESARIQKQIENHLGISGNSLLFEFRHIDNKERLDLITVNPRHHQSLIADLMASSAKTEQWIFTGGNASSSTIAILSIANASSTDFPFSHSVAKEEEAIAEPQPKVLNFASVMIWFSSTSI